MPNAVEGALPPYLQHDRRKAFYCRPQNFYLHTPMIHAVTALARLFKIAHFANHPGKFSVIAIGN